MVTEKFGRSEVERYQSRQGRRCSFLNSRCMREKSCDPVTYLQPLDGKWADDSESRPQFQNTFNGLRNGRPTGTPILLVWSALLTTRIAKKPLEYSAMTCLAKVLHY